MKKNFNLDLVNRFLDSIFPLSECFGVTCSEEDGEDFTDRHIFEDAIGAVDPDAKLTWGMSKMVIDSPSLDFVIKIPFNGYYSETYYEDGDNDELEWCDFYEAPTEDGYDYCLVEFEKFKELSKRGLSLFVANTIFYREIQNFRVFLQEKVNPVFYSGDGIPSKVSKKIALKWKKEKGYHAIDSTWIANCIDYYGAKKTEKFLNYCYNEDYDIISDCHNGNYGYREDGSPALLDFSGFFG